MIYSRLLYTEHEQPHNNDGEGAYTIFSTQQLFGADCVPLGDMSVQKFAVLWEGQTDTRVIDLIEQSIMLTILSPVRLLNASKGTLVVVHDSKLVGENYKLFCLVWEKIAAGVMYDEWTVLFVKDTGAGLGLKGAGSSGNSLVRSWTTMSSASWNLRLICSCSRMTGHLKTFLGHHQVRNPKRIRSGYNMLWVSLTRT